MSTTIEFSIGNPELISFIIYDLLGREVRVLLDGYKQAGYYTVTIDASDLSSGIYFYKLQVGEAIETKMMVLLK